MALLIFYRPKIILGVTALLWVGLSCLTAWAWLSGATDECGCYGPWLKTTPDNAFLENLLFLSLTLASWKGSRGSTIEGNRKGALSVAVGCAIGLALPLLMGFPISDMIHPESGGPRGDIIEEINVNGTKDLIQGQGARVVVIMGTDCLHCRELLPQLDDLAAYGNLPPMAALTKNSEAEVQRFMAEFEPCFPIGRVGEKDFWRLLGKSKMPKIMLVQDGRMQKVWEGVVPSIDEFK